MAKIVPSIGRRVWYWPGAIDLGSRGMVSLDSRQAFDAGVIHVSDERTVNLMVTDHIGKMHPLHRVTLLQADEMPEQGNFGVAQWMPYQQQQAAKHAASEDFK